MKIQVDCIVYAGTSAVVSLPDNVNWSDVASWYVKWDVLNLTLKDDTHREVDLNSGYMDDFDWKRPESVSVFAVSDDGETDYSLDIGESK